MLKGLLAVRASCLLYTGMRGMASTVDKALLSKLRKRTGISFINCKKALEQFENDIDQAEKWLKEQAQKEGWTKATKLQTRSMSSGLIAVVTNTESVTMVEVNCETDFVARNKNFTNLTLQLAQDCHQALTQQPGTIALGKTASSLPASDGKTLADHIALSIGNIGENMLLRRAVHVKSSGKYHLSSYVHAAGAELPANESCRLGKYGVVLSLNQVGEPQPGVEENSLDDLSYTIGQHIVGMNPKTMGSMDEALAEKRSSESDSEEASSEKEGEETSEGTDEKVEIVEKEEERLVFQDFLLEPSLTVAQVLHKYGATVDSFYRFACGEALPQDEEDS